MTGGDVIGIDVGGTSFRAGTVSPDGTLRRFSKVPTGQVFHTPDPMGDLCAFLTDWRRSGGEIEAVSIGLPGTLDRERRVLVQAPNIPFLESLPVADRLEEVLGVPVFLERDVSMLLLQDMACSGISREGIVAGIYYGTGIGNAICIDGRLLAGRNGAAGELGHIPADGSTLPCGCGNTGCLENLAGGKYLAELCRGVYAGTAIGDLFLRRGGEPLLTQFVDRMAMAAATEINILDPDAVIIGGGVPCMAGFPLDLLRERILARTRKPLPADNLTLLFTGDDEAKGVLGAARLAFSLLRR